MDIVVDAGKFLKYVYKKGSARTEQVGSFSGNDASVFKFQCGGIDHNVHIISPEAIEPIQKLKVDYLNSKNPRLHTDEILIALSASAAVNPIAELALSQLPKLKGCQAHTSVMLSSVDIKTFKKLGVQLTSEAVNERQILS